MKTAQFGLLLVLVAAPGMIPAAAGQDVQDNNAGAAPAAAAKYKVLTWNDLGMHCMDIDYSVFAILPPFNVMHAQVIDSNGKLVTGTSPGLTAMYSGKADPAKSINTYSTGKTNFWQFSAPIFGASLAPEMGLNGYAMPGKTNTPQGMTWNSIYNWFEAVGVPLTPTDNAKKLNYYPIFQATVKSTAGVTLGTGSNVLPVSNEMDCSLCHASNSGDQAAMPPGGWVNNSNPIVDYRLNILKYHDAVVPNQAQYQAALNQVGRPKGLYASALAGLPTLCAACHVSNALQPFGFNGVAGVPQLTISVHSNHASVLDARTGMTLDNENNRTACYTCHPGSATRCLRGAMGNSVAADGTMAMQCQSCHGSMSAVGASSRIGWLQQPNCQACHTGTAVQNNGQIRYANAFDTNGQLRVPVNLTFATNSNQPSAGYSLYRFSSGHGGLQCEACHNSTHAEYPASSTNDNLQAITIQGHSGPLADCTACHSAALNTVNGGPHGMHPIGQTWVSSHGDTVDGGGSAQCQTCHGTDYKGSVLSRAKGTRTFSNDFGTQNFWQGYEINCYSCHNGPSSNSTTIYKQPSVTSGTITTTVNQPGSLALKGTDPNKLLLTWQIVSQPANGTVGVVGTTATYYPFSSYKGTDTFTFAAWDGYRNSNLGTATVTVQ